MVCDCAAIEVADQPVPKQGMDDQRYSDSGRQQPECNLRKLLPQWQVLAVVHIERGKQDDVGGTHAGEMQPRPLPPMPAGGAAPEICGGKRNRSQDEQVRVLRPAHERQSAHRKEHAEQAPEVDRAEIRVSATPLPAQHCDSTGDHRREPEQDMDADNSEKDRVDGWYRDAQDDCRAFACHRSARNWSSPAAPSQVGLGPAEHAMIDWFCLRHSPISIFVEI